MTKAGERAKKIAVELRSEIPRNKWGVDAVAMALLNEDAAELLEELATLLASQEAEIAELRERHAELEGAQTGDGQP